MSLYLLYFHKDTLEGQTENGEGAYLPLVRGGRRGEQDDRAEPCFAFETT